MTLRGAAPRAEVAEQLFDEFAVHPLLETVPDLEDLEELYHPADVVPHVFGVSEVVKNVVQRKEKVLLF